MVPATLPGINVSPLTFTKELGLGWNEVSALVIVTEST
jgi:hypothetical protein